VQECSRVIAGTYDVIDFELDLIGFPDAEADLVPPLEELAATLDHRVVAVRRHMVKAVVDLEIGERLVLPHLGKRARHARQAVSGCYLIMTEGAGGRIGIGGSSGLRFCITAVLLLCLIVQNKPAARVHNSDDGQRRSQPRDRAIPC
jgi:hypothetical protein